ncbi:MAG TPA: helix-turn-helix transcriptional regulator [Candidatus Binataceae bacterium]|nr:helix-turn-helix transcriptional regulator [Candidatus Binataceae bacterium]
MADSKPEASPEKPTTPAAAAIPSVLSNDHSLGKIMSTARENRGLSREQAAKSSNIPGYYLTMIESDDYSSIADQLYLLPFLRRYATFVGLEPEEVASRFIRDVQRADMNPGRASEPIVMIADRKTFPWSTVLLTGGATIVVVAIAWFGYRHFALRKSAMIVVSPPVAEQPQVAPAQAEAPAIAPAAEPSDDAGTSADQSAATAPAPASPPVAAKPALAAKSPAAHQRVLPKPH